MFLSLLIILIIVLIAGAFFLMPGQPEGDGHELLQGLSRIRQQADQWLEGEEETGTATIYKWRDAQGEWHFSNTPPPEGVAVETRTYRTDVNVIQATRPPPAPKPAPPREAGTASPAPETALPGLPTPDKVKKLMDDVQAIKQASENRTRTLDRQIDAND